MNRIVIGASLLAIAVSGVACGSPDDEAGGAPAAKGGAANVGGGGASGGTTASGGTATAVAGAAGSGASLAGAGGVGGAAGSGGTTGGTAGQGGGGTPDAGVASALNGFRIEMPCGAFEQGTSDQVCVVAPEHDKQSYSLPVGGDSSKTYQVTLRVRGVLEPMTYTGGTLMSSIDSHYYVGGTMVSTDYNVYSLKTSDPDQIYYFNAAAAVGHTVFAVDYTVTIPMKGGTTLVVGLDGQNEKAIANFSNQTVEGITITQPYNGQFLQFDVVSVSPS